jgi:arylsulfatase A-like enzyme/tetratricopeptide (TPR) repeat protein
VAIAIAAGAGLTLARRAPATPSTPPSLLLVTIDTLRADRVGAWGGPAGLTPALDALAARGTTFAEAVSSVPLTLPSHSTIFSGLEPLHHGVRDNGTYVFPADKDTLATILQARGFSTGAFVGAYVLDRRFGLARGFGTYDDHIERRTSVVSALESERRGGEVAAAAEAWIAARTGPFFAWVHLYDPHAPYDPPSPHREAHPGQLYDGEVAYADACVARVVAAAERRAPGRVLVAVVADHGEALGEHGETTHGFFVYQSTLRVPLVIAGPGIAAGERRPGLARTTDLLPTLLARLGLPVPPRLDGTDLFGGPAPREAYAETLHPETLGWAAPRALRVGSLKLVDAPRPELYDLSLDPAELTDLSAARPDDVARLRSALGQARATEVTSASRASDPEVAERLRALGYAAAPPVPATDATRKDPKDAVALWRRFEEATWAAGRGDAVRAEALLADLLMEEPRNAVFRRLLSSVLRRTGRTADAVRMVEGLEELAPDDAVAWHEQAITLAEAGQRDEAIRSDQRAIALNPRLPEPHNHLGILLAETGRIAEALAAFDRAVAIDPNNALAWNNRANALRAAGRRAEAAESYRTAARLAPRDPDPRNGLGVLLVETGDLRGAAAAFREAVALEPRHAQAWLNLAVAQARGRETDLAQQTLRELLGRQPDAETARRARALLGELGGR